MHALDTVRLAMPRLSQSGSITLTSSTTAFKGRRAGRWGRHVRHRVSAVRSLAVELAPLRVNAVAPGVVRCPLWSGMSETDRESMYRTTGERLPLGRVAEVDDVARAYLALMDPGS